MFVGVPEIVYFPPTKLLWSIHKGVSPVQEIWTLSAISVTSNEISVKGVFSQTVWLGDPFDAILDNWTTGLDIIVIVPVSVKEAHDEIPIVSTVYEKVFSAWLFVLICGAPGAENIYF